MGKSPGTLQMVTQLLLAMCPGAKYLISLVFSFLICEMGLL